VSIVTIIERSKGMSKKIYVMYQSQIMIKYRYHI